MKRKKVILGAALVSAMGSAWAWQQALMAYTWAEGDGNETVADNYDVLVEQILDSNGLDNDETRSAPSGPDKWPKCSVRLGGVSG
jgi:hypothetical protein